VAVAASLLVGLLLPASALATFHLTQIREVFPGSVAAPKAEYVELQMYASGENLYVENNVRVTLYDASGTPVVAQPLTTHDPSHAQTQDFVLVGTATADSLFGVTSDYALPDADNVSGAGGAACYGSATMPVDCVSWGNFSGSLPSPTGGNVDPGGIPDGSAIERSIAKGCSATVDAVDDTNHPSDFFSDPTPDPHPNGTVPFATKCPNTTITKAPKSKTTDRTPTFKFKSSESHSTFRCKLDSKPYARCSSPDTLPKLKRGKHTFKVKAVHKGAADPTPASKAFKVVKKSR
jgi:hypothetical protein